VRRIVLKPGENYFLKINGFQCGLCKHMDFMTVNGYVGVPEDHPFFGMGEDRWDCIHVHGGWTATGYRWGGGKFNDLWWAGFDTCHAGDYAPGLNKIMRGLRKPAFHLEDVNLGVFNKEDTYRGVDFVLRELRRATKDLKKVKEND